MAEVLIFKKFFYYTIMVGSFPVLAQATVANVHMGILSTVIVVTLMAATLLPEGLLFYAPYRREVLKGIQNGDGETNREDLKYFISWYGPFSALRVIIFFSLFSMVESWTPPNSLLWALVAVGTGTALPQIKGLLKS